ncbi:hypothetical protein [Sinorhizobium sp. BJ1]|uniref:hypothetical protein n=1 Tax=Sinorhizobium sp. BJ1 TaxID=2035455 RepID=UPI000BE8E549|nr:hypothetical protein [Sinorhizobium sp. BJ1]PDT76964.1 hypothetical protein CO676_33490 [Sinorhizobium sp. BJ1]
MAYCTKAIHGQSFVLEINDEATLRGKIETLIGQLNPIGFSVEDLIVERDGVEFAKMPPPHLCA